MSHYPPAPPWATLGVINREPESGIPHEDEREQSLRQHPHVAPHTGEGIDKKSPRPFANRGPGMAENLRSIAERGAARRNGTAVNKNDVFTKPLPPIPRKAPQPATSVGQEGVFQGSGSDINNTSIHYVLNRSDMQDNQPGTSFSRQEHSQRAVKAGQKADFDGPVHSTEKMKPNLLLKECKLQGYSDETPSIQLRGSEPALPSIVPSSDEHYNAQTHHMNHSSVDRRLALAALCYAPRPETPHAQSNASPHRHDHGPTSWYEASPTGHEFIPEDQAAVAPRATPEREANQENEATEVHRPTIEKLLALIHREKENRRLANGNNNPTSPTSAFRLACSNSASTDIFHAGQNFGVDYQSPQFVRPGADSPPFASPGAVRELTPTTPVWSPSPSPCPKRYCYWSEGGSDNESVASPELQFDREWSNSHVPPQESPVLPSSSPLFPPLEECYVQVSDSSSELHGFDTGITVPLGHQFDRKHSASAGPLQESYVFSSRPAHVSYASTPQGSWDSVNPHEDDTGITGALGHQFEWDNTSPDLPLMDLPRSPLQVHPSPEHHLSDLREYSYADVSQVGSSPPHNVPHGSRLTKPTLSSDYNPSPSSYPKGLRSANMNSVDQYLVPQRLNVVKRNPTFTMNFPIRDVSQHQTAVHVSESAKDRHSRAASLVSNDSNANSSPNNSPPSRISRSPDVSSSEGSEGSRGTKRKRFTKNLFGKKGYLEDNEERPERRFKFIRGPLKRDIQPSAIWDENRALISSSKPSIVTDNTARITLNTDVQSILFAEIENMITHAANEFLLKEYYDGHLSINSLNKVKRKWERKNMPGVPEFHFDQATQYKIISANRDHLNFGKTSNGIPTFAVLRNWKRISKSMSIRTFVAPDSVIKKHIHDILGLLEILNANECHIELIMALNAHVRGELKKYEVMQHYRDTQNSANSRS
ncbi:uncharacterized protein N7500_000927 [Penicillium coprophilum]|uniref:uncharacterized protein n=1 Tax=Penicillium coprophilum TaxID=36646 RepID=UPI0023A286DD|nr:uncharacterized protein N7500_000927 [Penicillium coprophilum]KAJ5178228.1 hypothetical protein N7500_000927 [Penicillium coprophilum]